MTGWLLLFGTTRSLLELGRETKIRQWYFSLSCGRVGHCPVFQFIQSFLSLQPLVPGYGYTPLSPLLFISYISIAGTSSLAIPHKTLYALPP